MKQMLTNASAAGQARSAVVTVVNLGLAVCLATAGAASWAHDTWFRIRGAAAGPALLLGTGDRFPVMEYRVELQYLERHGCARQSDLASRGVAAGRPLEPLPVAAAKSPTALPLRLPTAVADPKAIDSHTCWASQAPFDIEIEPTKVDIYLDEIAAGPALRAAWAAQKAAGQPWLESYAKHARVEIGGAAVNPIGLRLEAVLLQPTLPREMQQVRFQLLHRGQPLVDQPVQLVSDRSRLGIWRRTDAQGQIALALPLAGSWMLRSTLLRPPAAPGGRWQSDFVTLAFDVATAGR